MLSTNGIDWTDHGTAPGNILSLAYGNGAFVGIGFGNLIFYSPDGDTWNTVTNPPGLGLGNVHFTNDRFFATGSDGQMFTSTNGINWAAQISGTDDEITSVAWDGTRFIAVGPNGTLLRSSNGVDWAQANRGSTALLEAAAFGNGIFAAVGHRSWSFSGSTILTSSNAIDWIQRPVLNHLGITNEDLGFMDVTYGGGRFVAVSRPVGIVTSTNGVDWRHAQRSGPLDANEELYGVAYGNGTFVAVGYEPGFGAVTYTSADGANWTYHGLANTNSLFAIAYGNGAFVAVGGSLRAVVLRSTDGLNWTDESPSPPVFHRLSTVAFGKTNFLAGGGASLDVFSSSDGTGWTNVGTAGRWGSRRIVFGGGYFLSVEQLGGIFTSRDGAQWTRRESGASTDLRGAAYGLGTFVAVGKGGTILQSDDLRRAILGNPHFANSGFSLTISGEPDRIYTLQSSSDLLHWGDVLTFTNLQGIISVTDTTAPVSGVRFYRVGSAGL
jgi:hypothetical protein